MSGIATITLGEQVDAYLAHWRALGRRYRQEEWLLGGFARSGDAWP